MTTNPAPQKIFKKNPIEGKGRPPHLKSYGKKGAGEQGGDGDQLVTSNTADEQTPKLTGKIKRIISNPAF